MKRVFIIHGWDGYPEEGWFPGLQRELEARGFHVTVPQMPDASTPKMESWIPFVAQLVGTPDKETYFVGHSIGVQTILRYLEKIDKPVGGVVAVAGFFTLIPESVGGPEEEKIVEPWLKTPMNFEKIKKNAQNIVAIFSDNDRFVPLENVHVFQESLGAETVVLHHKGHIGGSDNLKQVPEILEAVLKVAEAPSQK